MSLNLSTSHLKACLHVAGKKELRHYLCGVLVRARADGVLYVATDGKALLAAFDQQDADLRASADFIGQDLIVSRESLRGSLMKSQRLEVSKRDGLRLYGEAYSQRAAPAGFVVELIDGTFPEWERVIPEKVSGEAAQFAPAYTFAIANAFSEFGAKYAPSLFPNGDGAGVMLHAGAQFAIGVVMPFRDDYRATDYAVPKWIRG